MKMFIGWAYEAEWVERYVIPLVESYGVDVLTGKELQGKFITQGVKDAIEKADAALFITTRRGDPDANGSYGTSEWVLDEIKHANSKEKPVIIEAREEGVEYASHIHAERQHIPFNPADLMKCLVEIGNAIGQGRGMSLKLKLSPSGDASDKRTFTDALMQRLGTRTYECLYRIRQQGRVTHRSDSLEIVREGQDQYIYTSELPAIFFNSPDAFLEVDVSMGGIHWSSPGIRFNALEVPLERLDSTEFNVRKREV